MFTAHALAETSEGKHALRQHAAIELATAVRQHGRALDAQRQTLSPEPASRACVVPPATAYILSPPDRASSLQIPAKHASTRHSTIHASKD